jgi:type 2A phosphatase activator TIP41
VSETTERINIEKLKVREKILFYEDMLLFEDELADNGTSVLNARMVSCQSSMEHPFLMSEC